MVIGDMHKKLGEDRLSGSQGMRAQTHILCSSTGAEKKVIGMLQVFPNSDEQYQNCEQPVQYHIYSHYDLDTN